MPKSEGSGSSGTACVGSGGGGSGVALGKVFAVGRYQVTPEELLAEGNAGTWALPCGVPVEQGESGRAGAAEAERGPGERRGALPCSVPPSRGQRDEQPPSLPAAHSSRP